MKERKIGIVVSYLSTIVNLVSGVLLSVLLLRWLGATEYGLYQTVSSFAQYLILLEFGTGTVMLRNLSRRIAQKDNLMIERDASTIWLLTLFLCVVILLVGFGFYRAMGGIYRSSLTPEQIEYGRFILLFVIFNLVFSFLAQTLRGTLLAFERYRLVSTVRLARTIIRTFCILIVIWETRKVVMIGIIDMCISFVVLVLYRIECSRNLHLKLRPKSYDPQILKASLPLCFAILLQAVITQANSNVDKFLIGVFLSPETVSLYSISLFVFSVFSSLTTIPVTMYAPQVQQAVARGESRSQLLDLMVPPNRLILLVGGTIFFGFIVAGKQFLTIAYGAEYVQAWSIAVLLLAPSLIIITTEILINILDAENKRMDRSVILIITTVFNILLTLLIIRKYGPTGAAAATCIANTLGQILIMDIYYTKRMGINVLNLYARTFSGILPCQAISAACSYLLAHRIHTPFASLLTGGISYLLLFLILFCLFGATKTEKDKLIQIRNRLLRKVQH